THRHTPTSTLFPYTTLFRSSPDGKLIASASYDKLAKLWDASTGKEVRNLKDHIDAVFAIAFSPDGKWLATGSQDRSVKIWDVARSEEHTSELQSRGHLVCRL